MGNKIYTSRDGDSSQYYDPEDNENIDRSELLTFKIEGLIKWKTERLDEITDKYNRDVSAVNDEFNVQVEKIKRENS